MQEANTTAIRCQCYYSFDASHLKAYPPYNRNAIVATLLHQPNTVLVGPHLRFIGSIIASYQQIVMKIG